MSRLRGAWRVLLPFALHGLAREVDAAVGILLHTTLDLPGFVGDALGLLEAREVAKGVALWAAAGGAVWIVLAAARSRLKGRAFAAALLDEARGFEPLYLRPALTIVALASLAVRPTFPYGFTLPVALTQDWSIAQDTAALAALLALRMPLPIRVPAPGAGSIFFIALLAYGLLSPPWARHWDGHPGNEPKTLRMAVALGHGLTLDVEGVSAPMEQLQPQPLWVGAARAAGTMAGESLRLARAVARGAAGASAIQATRVTRQTIRGKEGGIFHVLAPGPSMLLAPFLRVDRALNLRRGTPGRLGLTLLMWNVLAAALVAAVFLLVRDLTRRAGVAALMAGGFGLAPPFLFYSYQFYPEMLGALLLTLIFRVILFAPRWTPVTLGLLGSMLAALPWLHQKFLPVWGVLTLIALVMAVDRMVRLRALVALLAPQLVTLGLFAFYNFAITGSVRPDALFLAWGPGGVSTARVGQGLLGLLLDARYGLLPYVPLYLLAAGGLLLSGGGASRLRLAWPAVAAYYLTVASADNWAGAVSNLGRFVMPIAPFLIASAAVALDRASGRRGTLALALTLAAWTSLLAVKLWQDPHAANDCALLLAKSVFADGNVYIPNLFLGSWSEAAPGLGARIAAWAALVAIVAIWFRRLAAGGGDASPSRVTASLGALVLSAAFLLESWPSVFALPRFGGMEVRPGTTAFLSGAAMMDGGVARARRGEVELLVRSRTTLESLALLAAGDGVVRLPGRPPQRLSPAGAELNVPLELLGAFTGRQGVRETLHRQRFRVETRAQVVLGTPGTAPSER